MAPTIKTYSMLMALHFIAQMSTHISGYNQFNTTSSSLLFYAALKLDRQGLRLLWYDTNNLMAISYT